MSAETVKKQTNLTAANVEDHKRGKLAVKKKKVKLI